MARKEILRREGRKRVNNSVRPALKQKIRRNDRLTIIDQGVVVGVVTASTVATAGVGSGVAPLHEINNNEAQTKPINIMHNLNMKRNLAEPRTQNQ
jgi:hypothetical protein